MKTEIKFGYMEDEEFEVVKENGDFTVDFEIDPERVYYLVKVTYSSGDSFNTTDGHVKKLYFTNNVQEAREVKEMVKNYIKYFGNDQLWGMTPKEKNAFKEEAKKFRKENMEDDYILVYKGTKIYCGSFVGYFENSQDVEIKKVSEKL